MSVFGEKYKKRKRKMEDRLPFRVVREKTPIDDEASVVEETPVVEGANGESVKESDESKFETEKDYFEASNTHKKRMEELEEVKKELCREYYIVSVLQLPPEIGKKFTRKIRELEHDKSVIENKKPLSLVEHGEKRNKRATAMIEEI